MKICDLCDDMGCDDCFEIRENISAYRNKISYFLKYGTWTKNKRLETKQIHFCTKCNRIFVSKRALQVHETNRTKNTCKSTDNKYYANVKEDVNND